MFPTILMDQQRFQQVDVLQLRPTTCIRRHLLPIIHQPMVFLHPVRVHTDHLILTLPQTWQLSRPLILRGSFLLPVTRMPVHNLVRGQSIFQPWRKLGHQWFAVTALLEDPAVVGLVIISIGKGGDVFYRIQNINLGKDVYQPCFNLWANSKQPYLSNHKILSSLVFLFSYIFSADVKVIPHRSDNMCPYLFHLVIMDRYLGHQSWLQNDNISRWVAHNTAIWRN